MDIEWAEDQLTFLSLLKESFALPSDHWSDLIIKMPSSCYPGGLLRILIEVDNPRVPARLLPGSKDERRLGLAVFGLGIS